MPEPDYRLRQRRARWAFAVVVVGAIVALVLAGRWPSDDPPAATRTATSAVTTTTARPATTTEAARPRWCSFYDRWKQASDTVASIERQYGSSLASWPDGAYERWERAFAAQRQAADMLWDGTEAGTVPRGWDARARACR